jgi:hypothetical protein
METPPLHHTIHLQSAIEIVRDGVVQERALLKVRELDGLRRVVKVFSRTCAATNRLPRA